MKKVNLFQKNLNTLQLKIKKFLNNLNDIKKFLKKMTIPYSRQSVNKEDVASVKKVLKSDFLTQGPEVEKFESALKKTLIQNFVRS